MQNTKSDWKLSKEQLFLLFHSYIKLCKSV